MVREIGFLCAQPVRTRTVVIVWKLNRLSRSLKDLLLTLEKIEGAGAEFERAMRRERTRNSLDAARKDERFGGRRPKLIPQKQREITGLVTSGQKNAAAAARLFLLHPSTMVRLLVEHRSMAAI